MIVSESIPRQVDKKSSFPEEEKGIRGSQGGDRGLEFSRRRKGQLPPPPHSLVRSIKLKPQANDYAINNSV